MQVDSIAVTIAVCTFRRLSGLRQCLMSLGAISRPANLQIEVVVVDNDASGSARALVETLRSVFPLLLRYFCETQSGVSHARNRCLREATGEWVAFVDDDEYVEVGWLVALWKVAVAVNPDGVFGPVLAQFESKPPEWLLVSGAHQRPRFDTGTPMRWGDCRSGNVLFRRSLFMQYGEFDARYAASGGEDCDFFWRCMAGGARLVWCDEACVHETVPATRMTRAWLLRRAYNGGRSFARLRASRGGAMSYLLDASWGLANLLVYGVPALVAGAFHHPRSLAFQRKVAGGLGRIVAPFSGSDGDYAGIDSGGAGK